MTTQLTTTKTTEATSMWSDEDIKLIKAMTAPDANPNEFKIFLYQAAKYHLDPLAKEIWCIPHGGGKVSIYASHAGLISIAHQTGQWGGMTSSVIRNDKGELIGATATCWRKDSQYPTTCEVAFKEYAGGPKTLWPTKPETMIKKVAEAHALRRAYNISGLYTPEEMDSATDIQQIDKESGEIKGKTIKTVYGPAIASQETTKEYPHAAMAITSAGARNPQQQEKKRTPDRQKMILEIRKIDTEIANLTEEDEDHPATEAELTSWDDETIADWGKTRRAKLAMLKEEQREAMAQAQ